jgi:SRSO17 transposase
MRVVKGRCGYWAGRVMPCERKSGEPMVALTAPARVAAQHQSLMHFVGEAVGRESLGQSARDVLPAIERHEPIEAWIIDDTFPTQGGFRWA